MRGAVLGLLLLGLCGETGRAQQPTSNRDSTAQSSAALRESMARILAAERDTVARFLAGTWKVGRGVEDQSFEWEAIFSKNTVSVFRKTAEEGMQRPIVKRRLVGRYWWNGRFGRMCLGRARTGRPLVCSYFFIHLDEQNEMLWGFMDTSCFMTDCPTWYRDPPRP